MIKSCPFCGLIFKGGNYHIYSCPKRPNVSKSKLKFLFIKHHFPEISIKEVVEEKYIKQLYSLPDLKIEYGIDYKNMLFLLDYFNIEKRNMQESAKKITSVKTKSTIMEKYGVENASKMESVKEKKKQTFIDHYGVDNIWKSEEFKKALPEIMMKKYGKRIVTNPEITGKAHKKWYDSLTEEEKQSIRDRISAGGKKWWKNASREDIEKRVSTWMPVFSKLEKRIRSVLDEMGYQYKTPVFVNGKSYDFRIKGTRILVEVNGDFWHANPDIYNEYDMIPVLNITAKEVWERDFRKKVNAEKYGYKVIYLWESEMNRVKDDELQIIMKDKIEAVKNEHREN